MLLVVLSAGGVPHAVSSAVAGAPQAVSAGAAEALVAVTRMVPVAAAVARMVPAMRLRKGFFTARSFLSTCRKGNGASARFLVLRSCCESPCAVRVFLAEVDACGWWGGCGVRAPGDAPRLRCRRLGFILNLLFMRVSAVRESACDLRISFGSLKLWPYAVRKVTVSFCRGPRCVCTRPTRARTTRR